MYEAVTARRVAVYKAVTGRGVAVYKAVTGRGVPQCIRLLQGAVYYSV